MNIIALVSYPILYKTSKDFYINIMTELYIRNVKKITIKQKLFIFHCFKTNKRKKKSLRINPLGFCLI